MPERYIDAIVKFLADRSYRPVKTRQLARMMGVSEQDYGTFRESIKKLRDGGRVVMGERQSLMLPEPGNRITGVYRGKPKGFGFIVPEQPNSHGDLFIPEGQSGGAMTGDRVVAQVVQRGKRGGESVYSGKIVQVLHRGENCYVGELQRSEDAWFVLPEGGGYIAPIVIKDVGAAGPKPGTKVVVEIVTYPDKGQLAEGVIVETIGESGPLDVETRAVIRAYGLREEFPPAALDEARAAVKAFDPGKVAGREDLSGATVVTIDPPDARDYDDAIGLAVNRDGTMTLGVHIADVSHFVPEGGPLDAEALQRGTSTYFPRRVVPMLPEILSNGVCSLQEGELRLCKSAFITYDADAEVVSARLAETVITSAKRLTYTQAQDIIDGKTGGYTPKVVELLQKMADLARRIEQRRLRAGMLQLDLPEMELVFDDKDRVVDTEPADDAYTHRIIEMFMVEANEAVARAFEKLNRPVLRRIHPEPDQSSSRDLTLFLRAAGHKLPRAMGRKEMQELLAAVRGKPESYAVNLALLKMMQQAEYSPMQIGHFALASEAYCHFTSPIRRYPDLTVHRMVAELCRGTIKTRPPEDIGALVKLGEDCSAAERRSEAAERELREVLILQLLAGKVGEEHRGVVDGVTNFGMFVQLPHYGIDGLIRFEDLGDDWWDVDPKKGEVRGERTGRTYRIGDLLMVKIEGVDIPRRQLNIAPIAGKPPQRPSKKAPKDGKGDKGGKGQSAKGKGGQVGKGGKRLGSPGRQKRTGPKRRGR